MRIILYQENVINQVMQGIIKELMHRKCAMKLIRASHNYI